MSPPSPVRAGGGRGDGRVDPSRLTEADLDRPVDLSGADLCQPTPRAADRKPATSSSSLHRARSDGVRGGGSYHGRVVYNEELASRVRIVLAAQPEVEEK